MIGLLGRYGINKGKRLIIYVEVGFRVFVILGYSFRV